MIHYMTRAEVETAFPPGSWQYVLFQELGASFKSETRPFPCVFGVAGYTTDQLRYLFIDDDDDAATVAANLKAYVAAAREYGTNTSLVVFFPPARVLSLEEYRAKFWRILRKIASEDRTKWPAEIPTSIMAPNWESPARELSLHSGYRLQSSEPGVADPQIPAPATQRGLRPSHPNQHP